MRHALYSLLPTYGLTAGPELKHTLESLKLADIERLLDDLDTWYRSEHASILAQVSDRTAFTLWLPVAPTNLAVDLSSRFVIADRILMDDTLYNYFSLLANLKAERSTLKFKYIDEAEAAEACSNVLLRKIAILIQFYEAARELVEADKLLPVIDIRAVPPIGTADEFGPIVAEVLSEDYARLLTPQDLSSAKSTFAEAMAAFVQRYTVLGALFFSTLSRSWPGRSVDLLDDELPTILNRMIATLRQRAPRDAQLLSTFSNSSFELPSLGNVPLAAVLDVTTAHQDALMVFKDAVEERISKIDATPGSAEWERAIEYTRRSIVRSTHELELAFKDTERDFRRRSTVELVAATFSVSVASVAAVGTSAGAIAGAVAGAAGLFASARALASDWLGFRQKKDELSRRDAYFLWKLKQRRA